MFRCWECCEVFSTEDEYQTVGDAMICAACWEAMSVAEKAERMAEE